MHRSLLALPALMLLPLGGCVVGVANGQTYSDSLRGSYANFSHVDVSAGVTAVVNQGPFDVKAEIVRGDSFEDLIVEVRGDTLHIGRKPQMWGGWDNRPQYRVSVSAPAYSGFDVSSGAQLDAERLSLKDVRVGVSSGAHATLGGTCASIDVDVSSGAHFDGEALQCNSARVDASSGASARAFATQIADGDASSGASVTFYGKPAQFREDTSSGGSVRAR